MFNLGALSSEGSTQPPYCNNFGDKFEMHTVKFLANPRYFKDGECVNSEVPFIIYSFIRLLTTHLLSLVKLLKFGLYPKVLTKLSSEAPATGPYLGWPALIR
jgi:hypothetical protein